MYNSSVKIDDINGRLQRYSMETQYENVHVADYDIVRSTQFADDLTHGVCVLHIMAPKFDNPDARLD